MYYKIKPNIKIKLIVFFFIYLTINSSILCGPIDLPNTVIVKFIKTINYNESIRLDLEGLGSTWEDHKTFAYVTMPLEEYIKGCVFAEIAKDSINVDVIKAQAIASRCFAIAVDKRKFREFRNIKDYDFVDKLDPGGQEYLAYVTSMNGYEKVTVLESIVNDVAGVVIKCLNRNTNNFEIIQAAFSNEFGTHSEDEADMKLINGTDGFWPSWWYRPQYLKRRDDNGLKRDISAANAIGLCQQGSIRLANKGWDYKKILYYYYSPNPAFIKWVKIYQGINSTKELKYYSYWLDERDTPDPIGKIKDRIKVVDKNEPLYPGALTFEIRTDECIDNNINLDVKFGKTFPYLDYTISGSWLSFNEHSNPTWSGTVTIPDQMTSNGQYVLSIKGKNVAIKLYKGNSELDSTTSNWLDSNPATVSKYQLSDGSLSFYESGADLNHGFNIETEIIEPPAGGFTIFTGNSPTDSINVTLANGTIVDTPVFLKGVIKGLLGPNFTSIIANNSYKNGFTAIARAAATLLFHERNLNKSSGYDVKINDTSSGDRIPYAACTSAESAALDAIINDICKSTSDGHWQIKVFWPDGAPTANGGPNLKTLLFPSIQGYEKKATQDAQSFLKKSIPFLNGAYVVEDTSIIPGLSYTGYPPVGMSALGALTLSKGGKSDEVILNIFYHKSPVYTQMIKVTSAGNNVGYNKEMGGLKATSPLFREVKINTASGITLSAYADIEVGFNEKISEQMIIFESQITTYNANGLMMTKTASVTLDSSRCPVTSNEEYPAIIKARITRDELISLKGNTTSSNSVYVTMRISAKDEAGAYFIDANPETPALYLDDRKDQNIYETNTSHSDKSNGFSIMCGSDVNDLTNGTGMGLTETAATFGHDVIEALERVGVSGGFAPVTPISLFDGGLVIELKLPRLNLDGAKWGYTITNSMVLFTRAMVKECSAFLGGMLQFALGGGGGDDVRGIKKPDIYSPAVDPESGLGGMESQILGGASFCNPTNGLFDTIQSQISAKIQENNKPGMSDSSVAISAPGESGNVMMSIMSKPDSLGNTRNMEMMKNIASLAIIGASFGGDLDQGAISALVELQELANKVSIGMALLGAVQMASNPAFGEHLLKGAIGYAKSWAEGRIKAFAFQQFDDLMGELIDSNEAAIDKMIEDAIKNLPGGIDCLGYSPRNWVGDALKDAKSTIKNELKAKNFFQNVFECQYGSDVPEWDLSKLTEEDFWSIAGQLAGYINEYNGAKNDLLAGSAWMNDFSKNTLGGITSNLQAMNMKQVKLIGKSGEPGEQIAVANNAISTVGGILKNLGLFGGVTDMVTGGITTIGPILVSIFNTEEGNLLSTVKDQMGKSNAFTDALAKNNIVNLQQLSSDIFPIIDLGGILGPFGGLKLDVLPFMNMGINKLMESMNPEDDPGTVLKNLTSPGEIGIYYPVKLTQTADDPPMPNHDGWIRAVTTDNAQIHVRGWARDTMPQFVKVYAQADNGPIVTTLLNIDNSLVTVDDGKIAQADWALDIPLPHAGANTVKVWTYNAGNHRVDTSFTAYLVGTTFPQQGTRAIPICSYVLKEYHGLSLTSMKGGTLSFLRADVGQPPVSEIFTTTGSNGYIEITYPDGTPNPDIEIVDATTLEHLTSHFVSGPYRLKLKSKYTGKSFVNIIGAADSREFQGYKLQYSPGWVNRYLYAGYDCQNLPATMPTNWTSQQWIEVNQGCQQCMADNQAGNDYFDLNGGIIESNHRVGENKLFSFMTGWDVWSKRLTGQYTIRTKMTDNYYNWNDKEFDRAQFTLGTPIDFENEAPTIVTDPYAKMELLVPEHLVKQTEYVNVYTENTDPLPALPNNLYGSFTNKFGVYPGLDSSRLNGSGTMKLTIKFTDEDLKIPGMDQIFDINASSNTAGAYAKAMGIIRDNIGIYSELSEYDSIRDVTITTRSLIPTEHTQQSEYRVFNEELTEAKGKYYLMAADTAPIFRHRPSASPLIFNPEEPSKGRLTTKIYFHPAAVTSKYVYANINIVDFDETRTVNALYRGIDNKDPIELHYVGNIYDPTVEPSTNKQYYFYNFVTYTPQQVLPAPLNGIEWNGTGARADGTFGIVEDGVYKAKITLMDSFGNTAGAECMIVKGRMVPRITQIGGKSAANNMSFDASNDGAVLSVIGSATAGDLKNFKGYMVGYRPSYYKTLTYAAKDEYYTYLPVPYPEAGSSTVSRSQITNDRLADWDITALPNNQQYDLALLILGADITGKVIDAEGKTVDAFGNTMVIDTAVIENVMINNATGIYNEKADPNPFSSVSMLSANVITDSAVKSVTFTVYNKDTDQVYFQQQGAAVTNTARYEAFLDIPALASNLTYTVKVEGEGVAQKEFLIRKLTGNAHITADITSPTTTVNSDIWVAGTASVTDTAAGNVPKVAIDSYTLEYKTNLMTEYGILSRSETGVENSGLGYLLFDTIKSADLLDLRLTVSDTAGNIKTDTVTGLPVGFACTVAAEPFTLVRDYTVSPAVTRPISFNYYLSKDADSAVLTAVGPSYSVTMSSIAKTKGSHGITWYGGTIGAMGAAPLGNYTVTIDFVKNGQHFIAGPAKFSIVELHSGDENAAQMQTIVDGTPRPYFDYIVSGTGRYDTPIPLNVTVTGYATEQWMDHFWQSFTPINFSVNSVGDVGQGWSGWVKMPYNQNDLVKYSLRGWGTGTWWYLVERREPYYKVTEGSFTSSACFGRDEHINNGFYLNKGQEAQLYGKAKKDCLIGSPAFYATAQYKGYDGLPDFSINTKCSSSIDLLFEHKNISSKFFDIEFKPDRSSVLDDWPSEPRHGSIINPYCAIDTNNEISLIANAVNSLKPTVGYEGYNMPPFTSKITGWGVNAFPSGLYHREEDCYSCVGGNTNCAVGGSTDYPYEIPNTYYSGKSDEDIEVPVYIHYKRTEYISDGYIDDETGEYIDTSYYIDHWYDKKVIEKVPLIYNGIDEFTPPKTAPAFLLTLDAPAGTQWTNEITITTDYYKGPAVNVEIVEKAFDSVNNTISFRIKTKGQALTPSDWDIQMTGNQKGTVTTTLSPGNLTVTADMQVTVTYNIGRYATHYDEETENYWEDELYLYEDVKHYPASGSMPLQVNYNGVTVSGSVVLSVKNDIISDEIGYNQSGQEYDEEGYLLYDWVERVVGKTVTLDSATNNYSNNALFTGTVSQTPFSQTYYSITFTASIIPTALSKDWQFPTKRSDNNLVYFNRPSVDNIFRDLANDHSNSLNASSWYATDSGLQMPFPSAYEYQQVTKVVQQEPFAIGPYNVPHSSTWTVQGAFYPGTNLPHEDVVVRTYNATTLPDGFQSGETYNQYDIDKVVMELKPPSADPYVSKTYVKIMGNILSSEADFDYYVLEYKKDDGSSDPYHLIGVYNERKNPANRTEKYIAKGAFNTAHNNYTITIIDTSDSKYNTIAAQAISTTTVSGLASKNFTFNAGANGYKIYVEFFVSGAYWAGIHLKKSDGTILQSQYENISTSDGVFNKLSSVNVQTDTPAGALGYMYVKDKIGRYKVKLTEVRKDGKSYTKEQNVTVGHVIDGGTTTQAAVGGMATDAYEQVQMFFPPMSLRHDKVVSITPIRRSEVPLLQYSPLPTGLIYSFSAADPLSTTRGRLRRDDFIMDSLGNIPNPAVLTMNYDERQISGFTEGAISLYKIDLSESGKEELMLLPAVVDTVNNVITTEIDSFSTVQVLPNYDPPVFEIQAAPNPAGYCSNVTIHVKSSKTLSMFSPAMKLDGVVALPAGMAIGTPNPVNVPLSFTQVEKVYLTGTAGVDASYESQLPVDYASDNNKLLILGAVIPGVTGTLPNNGIIDSTKLTGTAITLTGVTRTGGTAVSLNYLVKSAGIASSLNDDGTINQSRFWVSLITGPQYVTDAAEVDVVSVLSQFIAPPKWSWTGKGTPAPSVVNKDVLTIVQETDRRLVLIKTQPGEALAFPYVNWFNNKKISIDGQAGVYTLKDIDIDGNVITGVTVSAHLADGTGNTYNVINPAMDNAGWRMFAPVNEYNAVFTVMDHVPQGVSDTVGVSIMGVDLLGNTGENHASFVIDTLTEPVKLTVDKTFAKAGDTVLIRAKSAIPDEMPQLSITAYDGISRTPDTVSEIIIPGSGVKTGEVIYKYIIGVSDAPATQGDMIVTASVPVCDGSTASVSETITVDTYGPVFSFAAAGLPASGIAGTGFITLTITSEALRTTAQVRVQYTDINTRNVMEESVQALMLPAAGSSACSAIIDVRPTYMSGNLTITASGYDLAGNFGDTSYVLHIDTSAPGQVKNLAARIVPDSASGTNVILVTWDPLADADLCGYILTIEKGTDGSPAGVTTAAYTLLPGVVSYTDTGLAYGEKYRYTIAGFDCQGNRGISSVAELVYDLTPPVSRLDAIGNSYSANTGYPDPLYISQTTLLKLTATDDASGVHNIYYGFVSAGANALIPYAYPFVCPALNTRTAVYHRAVDMNGNTESLRASYVYVDTKIPETSVLMLPCHVGTGGTVPLAPVPSDISTWDRDRIIQEILAASGNSLSAMSQELLYMMDDDALAELLGSLTNVSASTSGLTYINNMNAYFEPLANDYYTRATVTAGGIILNDDPGSGVRKIEYRINTENAVTYSSMTDPAVTGVPFRVTWLAEGLHTIEIIAGDNVGNKRNFAGMGGNLHFFAVDRTPPVSDIRFSGPYMATYTASGGHLTLLGAGTTVRFTGFDTGAIPSGLGRIEYSLDGTAWYSYVSPVTLPLDAQQIYYIGIDNVDNRENTKTALVAVDRTPPVSYLDIAGPHYPDPFEPAWSGVETLYVTAGTTVTVKALDQGATASGVARAEYKQGDGSWTISDPADPQPIVYAAQGEYFLYMRSTDNMGNRETVKTVRIIAGGGAAEVSIVPEQGRSMWFQGVPLDGETSAKVEKWIVAPDCKIRINIQNAPQAGIDSVLLSLTAAGSGRIAALHDADGYYVLASDFGLPAGTDFRVAAVVLDNLGSSVSAESELIYISMPATRLKITPMLGLKDNGQFYGAPIGWPFTVSVTAIDDAGYPDIMFTGSATISFFGNSGGRQPLDPAYWSLEPSSVAFTQADRGSVSVTGRLIEPVKGNITGQGQLYLRAESAALAPDEIKIKPDTSNSTADKVDHYLITTVPDHRIAIIRAGDPVALTVTAVGYDSAGNTIVVNISRNDLKVESSGINAPAVSGLPVYATMTAGTASIDSVIHYTAGNKTVTASVVETAAGIPITLSSSINFSVLPAAFRNYVVQLPAVMTLNTPVRITITAYDLYGNIKTDQGALITSAVSNPAGVSINLSGPSGSFTGGIQTAIIQTAISGTYTLTFTDSEGNTASAAVQAMDNSSPLFAGISGVNDPHTGGALTLSWNAASDASQPVTYLVYMAQEPGSYDFNAPAGSVQNALEYTAAGLVNGHTYYFTVRAADAAGNTDTNNVELSGIPTGPAGAAAGNMPVWQQAGYDSGHSSASINMGPDSAGTKFIFPAAGTIKAQPVIDYNGDIYAGDTRGIFYAVYPNGLPKWYQDLARPVTMAAAVDFTGNTIFVSTYSALFALSASTGDILWQYDAAPGYFLPAPPVITTGGRIMINEVNSGSAGPMTKLLYFNGNSAIPAAEISGIPALADYRVLQPAAVDDMGRKLLAGAGASGPVYGIFDGLWNNMFSDAGSISAGTLLRPSFVSDNYAVYGGINAASGGYEITSRSMLDPAIVHSITGTAEPYASVCEGPGEAELFAMIRDGDNSRIMSLRHGSPYYVAWERLKYGVPAGGIVADAQYNLYAVTGKGVHSFDAYGNYRWTYNAGGTSPASINKDNSLVFGAALNMTGVGQYSGPALPLNVTAVSGEDSIRLKWRGSAAAGGYAVYRTTIPRIMFEEIISVTSTAFDDVLVDKEKTYYYAIASRDGSGSSSYLSNITSGMAYNPPQAPVSLTAVAVTDIPRMIILNWTGAQQGTYFVGGYEIYRSTSSGGTFTKVTKLAGASNNSYQDTEVQHSVPYYYVRAFDVYGHFGPASETKQAQIILGTPPSAPYLGYAAAIDNFVRLGYSPGAGGTFPFAGYRIYRSSASGGPYTQVGEINFYYMTHFDDYVPSAGGYCYVVRAFDTMGLESAFSNEQCVEMGSLIAKSANRSLAQTGDTITYSLEYKTNASTTITGARISDTLPAMLEYTWSDAGLAYNDNNISWDIGLIAAGTSGSKKFAAKTLNPYILFDDFDGGTYSGLWTVPAENADKYAVQDGHLNCAAWPAGGNAGAMRTGPLNGSGLVIRGRIPKESGLYGAFTFLISTSPALDQVRLYIEKGFGNVLARATYEDFRMGGLMIDYSMDYIFEIKFDDDTQKIAVNIVKENGEIALNYTADYRGYGFKGPYYFGIMGSGLLVDDVEIYNTKILNTAAFASAGPNYNCDAYVGVDFPELSILKSADRETAREGDTLTYTLNFGNTGGRAHSVAVEDRLDSGLAYLNSGGTFESGTVSFDVPVMEKGSTGERKISALINNPVVFEDTFSNTTVNWSDSGWATSADPATRDWLFSITADNKLQFRSWTGAPENWIHTARGYEGTVWVEGSVWFDDYINQSFIISTNSSSFGAFAQITTDGGYIGYMYWKQSGGWAMSNRLPVDTEHEYRFTIRMNFEEGTILLYLMDEMNNVIIGTESEPGVFGEAADLYKLPEKSKIYFGLWNNWGLPILADNIRVVKPQLVNAADIVCDESRAKKSSNVIKTDIVIPPYIAPDIYGSVTGTCVSIVWTNAYEESYPVSGYNVYRNISGTAGFDLISTAGKNTLDFIDCGVNTGMSYVYRVSAFDTYGNTGNFTKELELIIPGDGGNSVMAMAAAVFMDPLMPEYIRTIGAGTLMPVDIAEDSFGNLYVTDMENNRVMKYDVDGNEVAAIGSAGNRAGEFNGPAGISVADDKVYVVDSGNNRVGVFDLFGNFVDEFGRLSGLRSPADIAVKNGRIFVTDTGNNRVVVFGLNGVKISEFGNKGKVKLGEPSGIYALETGLYIVDSKGMRVIEFGYDYAAKREIPIPSDNGKKVIQKHVNSRKNLLNRLLSISPDYPYDVSVDASGGIYVTDRDGNRFERFDSEGHFKYSYGIFGSAEGEFDRPHGIMAGAGNRIYIADTNNRRVQVYGEIDALLPMPAYAAIPGTGLTIGIISLSPSAINPDNRERSVISYALSRDAAVRMIVVDEAGRLVYVLDESRTPGISGLNSVAWDGKDTYGISVKPGKYMVRLLAKSGAEEKVDDAVIVVNNPGVAPTPTPVYTPTPVLTISGCYNSPNPFSPGSGERTVLYYTISMDAAVNIVIKDAGGSIVRAFASAGARGQNSVVWDGRDQAGLPVITGPGESAVYTCEIGVSAPPQSAYAVFNITALNPVK